MIHLAAGVSGFVAAAVIGPRLQRDREIDAPNNLAMVAVGAGLLWLGWNGFNGGDAVQRRRTRLGGGAEHQPLHRVAFLVWVGWDYVTGRKPSLIGSVNGMIVGLVAITPGGRVRQRLGRDRRSASIASTIVYFALNYLSRLRPFRNVDDTLGVVYTHGFAGLVGGLLVGIFASSGMAASLAGLSPVTRQRAPAEVAVLRRALGDRLLLDRHVRPAQAGRTVRTAADVRGGHGDGRPRSARARGLSVRHPVARVSLRSAANASRGARRRRARGELVAKIIVSYDGSDYDRDALAFGKLLARTGATLELAYVRHAHESKATREQLAEHEAEELLASGALDLGAPATPQHVVFSGSTPDGLRDLALETGASMIVFGSEYRTTPGHVDPQASARRLLDGGPVALGVAPAGFHETNGYPVATVAAVGEDDDPSVLETAEAIAARFGAALAPRATAAVDLIVVGSKSGTPPGPGADQRGRGVPDRARPLPGDRASARHGSRPRLTPRAAGTTAY